MVRPALCVAALILTISRAHASEVPRGAGMYTQAGAALAVVDSKIDVAVRGPILETVVTQRFRNATDHATEATYIFPLPHDAAVTAMSIKNGTRTIHASIEPREDAQRRYEQAVSSGVAAALLDQERVDIFTQTVAAIPARGVVEITLRYDSVARFQDGTWELVLPLVVAPRYVPGVATGKGTTGSGRLPDTDRAPDASRVTPPAAPGSGGATEVALHFDTKPDGVTSPSHELVVKGGDVTFVDPHSDHDAIVRWRGTTAGGWVEQSGDGGYAAVVVTAPTPAARRGTVRTLLVLDRSAASRGDADAVARPFVRALLAAMTPADRIAVTGSDAIGWSVPGDAARNLEALWGSAPAAFDLTRTLLAARPDGAPIVLVTGGLVADDAAAVAAAKKLGVPVHVVGVGPAPARGALVQLAAATGGTARFAQVGDDAAAMARAILADAATQPQALSVTWGTLSAVDVVPAQLPRLGAGQAMLVLARVTTSGIAKANGRAGGELFAIDLLPAGRAVEGATTVMGPLARRWARNRLDEMLAARTIDRAAVAKHALRYGLVSPFTSMVAIGDEVVVQGGVKRSVPVQVSVPAGMKWQAVKKETSVDMNFDARLDERPGAGSGATTRSGNSKDRELEDEDGKLAKEDKNKRDRGGGKATGENVTQQDPAKVVAKPPSSTPVRPGVVAGRDTRDAKKEGAKRPPEKKPSTKTAPKGPEPAQPITITGTAPTIDQTTTSPPPPPAPKPDGYSRRHDAAGGDGDDDKPTKKSKKSEDDAESTLDEDTRPMTRKSIALAGATASENVYALDGSYGARKAWRLTAAFGGGLGAERGEQVSLLSLGGRFEFGGRGLVGLDGSLWLVTTADGSHAQGRILASFARRGIARFLELGGGLGLHLAGDDGAGPAVSLGLRFHLPMLPRAAGFLRYDGALLIDDASRHGLNTFTLGAELGF